MTPAAIYAWRLPGCGDDCQPRRHDPVSHEAYGARQERARAMREARLRVVRTGPLLVNRDARTALVDGVTVPLSPTEWRILDALAGAAGATVAYEDLAQMALGAEWACVARPVVLNNFHVHRCRLRGKLGRARSLVVTVKNVGMRLEVDP